MSISIKFSLLFCAITVGLMNCSGNEHLNVITPDQANILAEDRIIAAEVIAPASNEERNSGLAQALYEIGVSLIKTDENAAKFAFKEALRIKPDYAEAYYQLGNLAFTRHKNGGCGNVELPTPSRIEIETAAIYYRKTIRLKPDYFSAYRNLIFGLVDVDRQNEAELIFQKMVGISPETSQDYYDIAEACYKLQREQEAIKFYELLASKAIANIEIENAARLSLQRSRMQSSKVECSHVFLEQAASRLHHLYSKYGNKKLAQNYKAVLWTNHKSRQAEFRNQIN